MTEPLKLISRVILDRLASDLEKNLEHYRVGDFAEFEKENGWAIETSIARWDPTIVARLDAAGTPEAEIRNSLLVYNGLKGMTPALARDERLWARLCHIECLQYTRERWLGGNGPLPAKVRLHFFANGLTGCRDDNAIGRLWWNGHIASLASPGDVELGLRRLLARANIRLQVIDRADTAFRQPLISGIVRLLGNEAWFETYDAAVADFMLEVNKRSGSVIFEALTEGEIDAHLILCLELAKARTSQTHKVAA